MIFAEWLKSTMKQNDMRGADVARLAHISQSIITRVLNGTSNPHTKTKAKILSALGVDSDAFSEVSTPVPIVIPTRSNFVGGVNAMCQTLQLIGNYQSIEEALEDAIRIQLAKKEKTNAPHQTS
jgi:transcriptional regulator with XRE-family HTH domain